MKVTKTINAAQEGVELRFSEKPPQSVLDLLHEQEWRFSRKDDDPRWWRKYSPAADKFASNLLRILNDDEPASVPAPTPAKWRCNRCHAPMSGAENTPAQCACGGMIESARGPARPKAPAAERVTIRIPAMAGVTKSFF